MIDGVQRRKQIIETLKVAERPVSATKFAEEFGVSRQIVVGDIALLRAAGEEILATTRGYKMEIDSLATPLETRKIVVTHNAEDMRDELETIVELNGQIIDVVVEHEVYGEVVVNLHIKSQKDIEDFLAKYEDANASLLSELTDGVHLHTIAFADEQDFAAIQTALSRKGYLYEAS